MYFLFCKDEENDEDSVYIGEAENVKDRLLQHLRDAATEKKNITGIQQSFLQVVTLTRP